MKIDVASKSVNSRILFEDTNDIILDSLETVDLDWSDEDERSLIIEFLNTMFMEMYNAGQIDQWKVQCNNNNNQMHDMLIGKYILDVFYKQRHCLNTTNIRYILEEM